MSILVPTDFSECSRHAFDLAVEICKKSGSELVLVHVADLPVASDPMGTNLHTFFSPDLLKQMEENLMEKLTSFAGEADVSTQLIWGNPFSGISGYLARENFDLIIMGTKGASGIKELFIGSNTEKVVRHSTVPVLSVKSAVKLSDLHDIVFGYDLISSSSTLIQRIKELQRLFDAKLHVVRVNTPSRFKPDREVWPLLESFTKDNQLQNFTLNIFGDYHEDQGLIYFANQIDADMIAIGTHGRKGFSHLFGGSIAEDIVNHAKRPIWTYIIK